MNDIRLAPRHEQPIGGYKHKHHLLGYGPVHKAWAMGIGWYETNTYCISPSSKLWRKDFLRHG